MYAAPSFFYLLKSNCSLRWMGILAFSLLPILPLASPVNAQESKENMGIEIKGSLWIEGTAGIMDYRCNIRQLSQAYTLESSENPKAKASDPRNVTLSLTFPVTSFECERESMTRDLYEALKYDSFPTIRYELLKATLPEDSTKTNSSAWIPVQTEGIMEMAGVRENTSFSIKGKVLGNRRYKVKGSKKIHMDTYDIEPPSKMGGLVTADKLLSVHFDVLVELQQLH